MHISRVSEYNIWPKDGDDQVVDDDCYSHERYYPMHMCMCGLVILSKIEFARLLCIWKLSYTRWNGSALGSSSAAVTWIRSTGQCDIYSSVVCIELDCTSANESPTTFPRCSSTDTNRTPIQPLNWVFRLTYSNSTKPKYNSYWFWWVRRQCTSYVYCNCCVWILIMWIGNCACCIPMHTEWAHYVSMVFSRSPIQCVPKKKFEMEK